MTEGSAGSEGEGVERRPVVPDGEVWRLVAVAGVHLELPSQYPEIVLHEQSSPFRELRIPVALADGSAVAAAWKGRPTARPLTHVVWWETLGRHNVRVEAVRITARRGGVFYAELDTMGPSGRQVVASRPSDALALTLRAAPAVPVLVADWVFADPPVG